MLNGITVVIVAHGRSAIEFSNHYSARYVHKPKHVFTKIEKSAGTLSTRIVYICSNNPIYRKMIKGNLWYVEAYQN